MCCFFTTLVFFGPRLGFLVYWLLAPGKVNLAFEDFQLPLAGRPREPDLYPLDHPDVCIDRSLERLGLIWFGLGILADVASYLSGYHKRQVVPGYPTE